jgi:hypothetical protein
MRFEHLGRLVIPFLEDIRNIRPRTEEFVKKIKEELMERTWHPSRYMEWCWDEDEKASLMEDTA